MKVWPVADAVALTIKDLEKKIRGHTLCAALAVNYIQPRLFLLSLWFHHKLCTHQPDLFFISFFLCSSLAGETQYCGERLKRLFFGITYRKMDAKENEWLVHGHLFPSFFYLYGGRGLKAIQRLSAQLFHSSLIQGLASILFLFTLLWPVLE